MDIQKAGRGDIPGLLALLDQVGQVHHRLRPDIFKDTCLKYSENDLLSLLQDENKPIFVAKKGRFVAGYCFCQLRDYRDSATFTPRLELYIDDLCVDEKFRGAGVAQALFDQAWAHAQALDCQFVALNVWCGNVGAEKFYEKMGLKPRHVMMERPC